METEKTNLEQELSIINGKLESGELKNLKEVELYCQERGFPNEDTNSFLDVLQTESEKKSKSKKTTDKEQPPIIESKEAQKGTEGKDFVQNSIDTLKNSEKSEIFGLISGIMDMPYRSLQVRVSGAMSAILDKAALGEEDGAKIVSEISDAVAKIAHTAKFNQYMDQIQSIYKTVGTAIETKLSQMAQATDDLLKSLGE